MITTYAHRFRQAGARSLGTIPLGEVEEMTYDEVLARMFENWTIQSVARPETLADVIDPDVRALRNNSNPGTTDVRLSDDASWRALPVGIRHLAVTGTPTDDYETAGEGVDFALAAYTQWRNVQHRIDRGRPQRDPPGWTS